MAKSRIETSPLETRNRIAVLDVARGVAIVGMFALHCISPSLPGAWIVLSPFLHERVQALFGVLDGMSIGLLSARSFHAAARTEIAIRGMVLVALGLFLTSLQSGIVVILDVYGVCFLLVIPILFVKGSKLVLIGLGFLLLGPAIAFGTRQLFGIAGSADFPAVEQVPAPLAQLVGWLFVGQYPACIWLGYIVIGLSIQRLGLLIPGRQRVIFVLSLVTAVAGTTVGLVVRNTGSLGAHTALWIGSTGASIALITGLLLLDRSRNHQQKWSAWRWVPFSALGRMPVSVYFAHVLYFSIVGWFVGLENIQGWRTFVVVTLGCVALSSLWLVRFDVGPIEALTKLLTQPAHDRPHRRPQQGRTA